MYRLTMILFHHHSNDNFLSKPTFFLRNDFSVGRNTIEIDTIWLNMEIRAPMHVEKKVVIT